MTTTKHPAACPYCGGTDVNVAQPDYLLRAARLNDDGSITIGESDSASDFNGLTLLHCHSCVSEYPQPASVVEHFDDSLKVEYPLREPSKGEPGYIGAEVIWVPLTAGNINVISSALRAVAFAHHLDDFLCAERDRQMAHEPNFARST